MAIQNYLSASQLDSKTEQYSVVIQYDDERRTAMHKAALEGRTELSGC